MIEDITVVIAIGGEGTRLKKFQEKSQNHYFPYVEFLP